MLKEDHQNLLQPASSLDWNLTPRQHCDVELMLNGELHPLSGFLTQTDYYSVIADKRLSTGELWPIPIALDISVERTEKLSLGDVLLLKDSQGDARAALEVSSPWEPDKQQEAA